MGLSILFFLFLSHNYMSDVVGGGGLENVSFLLFISLQNNISYTLRAVCKPNRDHKNMTNE